MIDIEQLAQLEIDRLEKRIEELEKQRLELIDAATIDREQEFERLIGLFKKAVELLAEKMCDCLDGPTCRTCIMRKHLTWWIVSQAPGATGHPDAGKNDD